MSGPVPNSPLVQPVDLVHPHQRRCCPGRDPRHEMAYQLPLLGTANPALSHPRYPFLNQPLLASYLGQPLLFDSNLAAFSDVEVMLLDSVPESQWPSFVREGIQTAQIKYI